MGVDMGGSCGYAGGGVRLVEQASFIYSFIHSFIHSYIHLFISFFYLRFAQPPFFFFYRKK